MTPTILIVGGGMAGLTAALGLLRKGFDVRVAEQAPELREVGAGLQISPNGSRLLTALGLGDALRDVAVEPEGKEVRIWNTGESRSLFDLGTVSRTRYGHPYLMIHRADLHGLLAAAIEEARPGTIQLGLRLTAADGLEDGAREATAHFKDMESWRADVLIGADGVHSTLRKLMFDDDSPCYTGCMAWRGVARADTLPPSLRRRVGTNWVGPGRHVIHYPIRNSELINFVGIVERSDWTVESWSVHGTREECAADYSGWHEDVQRLIANLEDEPNKWGLMGRQPMDRWWRGRACLIGDACHPTLPFLAQGANMAIEDGFLLARCLDHYRDDVEEGFRRFQDLRHERTSRIVLGSAENAGRFHNPALADPVEALRYVDEQWRPDRVEERYDWLFSYAGERLAIA
jgi:salicylate hydroxylase